MLIHCRCDALPKKTIDLAVEHNNYILVQVKDNQPTLAQDIAQEVFNKEPIDSYHAPIEKQKNRIEERKIEVFAPPKFTDTEKWTAIKAVMVIERTTQRFDTKTKKWDWSYEFSFYMATCLLTAKDFSKAIRGHWSIENKNHRVRDGAFLEDASRIRKNPEPMAILRSFALNIMRANRVSNISNEMYKNALSLQNFLEYKGVKDDS